MGLKEATAEKHKMAERMPFNGKMFRGELTKEQYGEYLKSQYAIFTTLENNFDFPHEGLKRKEAVAQDLLELGIDWINVPEGVTYSIDPATTKYVDYIKTLDHDSAMAHVYLNYLAIMFGGQMIKTKVPSTGRMYDFENMMEAAGSIRAIQKDEWADEVNKGFDFMIEIFKELENVL